MDPRPLWKRAKFVAAIVVCFLAAAVLLFADHLDPSAQAIIASAIPAAISLFQIAQGRHDVATKENRHDP